MAEDLLTNQTAFFVTLLGNEVRRRKEGIRGKAGRPRKEDSGTEDSDPFDYSDDLPKNIPYFGGPDIGPREYADKVEFRKGFQPKG